jgi:hypothetical protein
MDDDKVLELAFNERWKRNVPTDMVAWDEPILRDMRHEFEAGFKAASALLAEKDKEIASLKERLAKWEGQTPVAWLENECRNVELDEPHVDYMMDYTPIYTAPPVREGKWVCTCGTTTNECIGTNDTCGYRPQVPDGWLHAIDEALVFWHLDVANATDTYEQAKEKLHKLINIEIAAATDPAVNGGKT